MDGRLTRLAATFGLGAALLGASVLPTPAWGQRGDERGGAMEPLPIQRLGEGIYGVQGSDLLGQGEGGTMNTGVVVGDDGVFVFACNDDNLQGRLAAIRTVTDKPIRWSANGHMAGDDSGCNPDLRAMGATLIGSSLMRENYLEWMPARMARGLANPRERARYEGRPLAPPEITFEDSLTLHLGEGRTVQLQWMGTGHTAGDTVAYMPEQKVLFTADLLFVELHPTVRDGDSHNWQRILDRLMSWDIDWIVPGHGRMVRGKEHLQALSRYYDFMREGIRARMALGQRPQQIRQEMDLGEFASWGRETALLDTVDAIYRELEHEQAGGRAGS